MEATTAAVEAPTTTKSTAMAPATAAHAASVSTAATAAAAATTSVTATTTTTATSECRSWLNQADRCQCEQGYHRFSHYAFPPLDEVAPKVRTLSQRDYSAIERAFAVN
jgi:hypothetical protein